MGQPIGSRYELQSQLGRGAFGSVWRGRVRDTGEAVAIKVLLEELANDADVVTRFLRERTALVSMRHRSLVSVRDLVVEGDLLALVMQLVEGPDLRAYLRGRGTLGAAEAGLLVADVAEALAVAHAAKIIHRDVKPANVLLQPEDGGYRPLLTDFGIARLADAPSVTRTSQVVGTPYYLAPEVISGQQPTPAVDVYACGIMFFELRTGRPPFRGNDAMEVFQAHQTQPPPRPEGVPDGLWTVIASALAKDPGRRPDAATLASRLRAAVKAADPGAAALVPVHPREGTVVLPKLPGEPAPVAPVPPATPGRTPAAVAAAAAAPTRPIPASYGAAAAAGAVAPAAPPTHVSGNPKPTGYPPQPVFPGPQLPPAHNVPQRGAYAPQPQTGYRPPQQPQQPPQRMVQPQQQRRVDAPPALRQAPRQPRPASAYEPLPKSGIGCLGKLAILLIVLALAALIGVEIGNRIAKNHNNPMNNRSGVSIIVPWDGFGGSSH